MRSLFLFALVCGMSLTICMGQPYHPFLKPGKYWDLIHTTPGNICQDDFGLRYVFEGDTLIEGKNYVKSYYYSFLQETEPCYEFYGIDTVKHFDNAHFLREDTISQQVFLYLAVEDTEVVLFDFGLVIGDTIEAYNIAGPSYPIRVLSRIDTIILQNGELRRRFIFGSTDYSYVEGIGSIWGGYGLFCPLCDPGLGFGLYLDCVNENGETLVGYHCLDFITEVEENNVIQAISISPNPTRNLVLIKLPGPELFEIRILDISGQLLVHKITRSETSISLRDKPQGIYLLQILDTNGTLIKTHKIVKTK